MNDLISRQAAIDLIDEYMDKCIELHYLPTGEGIKTLIFALPSAQQWIPVTESLPGYGEDVLLSINGVCSVGYCVATNGVGVDWYYDGWYHPENDVDAWMPLPEPWKEEKDE